jgi:hypothetical protein
MSRQIPLLKGAASWGPNHRRGLDLRSPKGRGARKGIVAIRRAKAWRALADRFRLLPEETP